jgi:chemotaxis signal transduction protein
VKAGGQTLGVPFASIKKVLKLSEAQMVSPDNPDHNQEDESVVMINLTQLLTGKAYANQQLHVVIVEAMQEHIALVVDGIASVRTVDASSYHLMPAVFVIGHTLFGGIVREQEALVLMISPDLLFHSLAAVTNN